jgi:uncharacterized protein with HEPN domain
MLDADTRAVELYRDKQVGGLADDETALALARLLEILGEAAGRVTLELRERHPEVPWRDVSDNRNRVVHQCFDVDMEVLEAIVRYDLPVLMESLEGLLKELEEEGTEDFNT